MPTPSEPQLNSTYTASLVVAESDLASALPLSPSDQFPAVFATARMVALMEIAASRLLVPCLGPGQVSVRVSVYATHSAPTPEGEKVDAEASTWGELEMGISCSSLALLPEMLVGRLGDADTFGRLLIRRRWRHGR